MRGFGGGAVPPACASISPSAKVSVSSLALRDLAGPAPQPAITAPHESKSALQSGAVAEAIQEPRQTVDRLLAAYAPAMSLGEPFAVEPQAVLVDAQTGRREFCTRSAVEVFTKRRRCASRLRASA